jgi:hypothetical protein
MGLQWNFGESQTTYLYDCRLPFGASRSCKIFQNITNSMFRMLKRAGYNCTAYIDDFLIIADDLITCNNALMYLLTLIRLWVFRQTGPRAKVVLLICVFWESRLIVLKELSHYLQ